MNFHNEDFRRFFGKKVEKYYGFEFALGRITGLIKKEKSGYQMTTRGSFYYHYFENYYTLSYIDQMWSLMKDSPFPKELIIK